MVDTRKLLMVLRPDEAGRKVRVSRRQADLAHLFFAGRPCERTWPRAREWDLGYGEGDERAVAAAALMAARSKINDRPMGRDEASPSGLRIRATINCDSTCTVRVLVGTYVCVSKHVYERYVRIPEARGDGLVRSAGPNLPLGECVSEAGPP